jgi:hypothetical protein
MSDPRIGTRTQDGVTWPSLSISGRPYTRPATTRNIGGGQFVVIDVTPTVDVDNEITSLITPKSKKVTKVDDDQRDNQEPSDTS